MKTGGVSARYAFATRFAYFAVISGVITFLLGKDTNWDIFNYHLYAPHAFWMQDLQTDFMAASVPRYFNPIGYLPFYWMVKAGWHSLAIALVLAAFHSISLLLLWEICARFLFKGDSHVLLLSSISVVLAVMSPVFLGTLGGTYLDPITLVFIFGGLLLLCIEFDRPKPTILVPLAAGCLMGLAAALKLTNLIYVASAGVAILVAARLATAGWVVVLWYAVGAAIGAAIAGGWWSIQLFREFGNPFFPLFNEIFHSPDFAQFKLSQERFKPASLLDALMLHFTMSKARSWIYVENAAADARFALLVVFAMVLPAIWQQRRKHEVLVVSGERNRPIELVVSFFIISFPIWVATSNNGRYALPILLIVAPVLILTVRAVSPSRSWFLALLIFVLALQTGVLFRGKNPRWDAGAWTTNWIDIDVPIQLKETPHGYLSVGANSQSFIALHLHPESRLISLLGVYPLSPDGPGHVRVENFITTHAGRLRTLGSLNANEYRELLEQNRFGEYLEDLDGRFALWNLRTDPTSCLPINFSAGLVSKTHTDNPILISCALLSGNPLRSMAEAEWKSASRVFDKIECLCPALFNPRGIHATKRGKMWYRLYVNTDTMLSIIDGKVSFSRFAFGPFDVDMGTVEQWEKGNSNWLCAIPLPHWKSPATSEGTS